MMKKFLMLVLACSVLVLSGCSDLFNKGLAYVTEHKEEIEEGLVTIQEVTENAADQLDIEGFFDNLEQQP